jgi:hypothetical protein
MRPIYFKSDFHWIKWRIVFYAFALAAFILFWFVTRPFLMQVTKSGLVGGDVTNYLIQASNTRTFYDLVQAFRANKNLIGPVLLIKLFNSNHTYIFVFNVLILYVAFQSLFKYFKNHTLLFTFCFFLNPLSIISLLSINKEILSIVALLYLSIYLLSRKISYFFVALLVGLFVRFELFAILVLFYFAIRLKSDKDRLLSLGIYIFLLSLGISIMFVCNPERFGVAVLLRGQSSD